MGNETAMIAVVFLGSLLIFGALAAALLFAGPSDKKLRRRLDRLRVRYGSAESVARIRSILIDQENAKPWEAMLGRLVPKPDTFRKRLRRTGRDIPLGRYAAISGGLAAGFFVLALFLFGMSPAFSLLGAIGFGIGLPHMVISKMIASRQKKFLAMFPEAIDLIVRGLKSGLPINETIAIVGNEVADPVGTEFRQIADQVRFGKTLDEALWRASEKLDFPDFKFFVISLSIQRETGGNLGETLGNLANILRQRQQMKLKIRALSSEGRASAFIIGALPFIMFGVIYMMNPAYAGTFFVDTRAMTVLIGALMWMGLGGFIISRMISFEI
ncbi:MAG: hypothetical protein Kow00104_04310 [Rhodothalassiaceae bacterium]